MEEIPCQRESPDQVKGQLTLLEELLDRDELLDLQAAALSCARRIVDLLNTSGNVDWDQVDAVNLELASIREDIAQLR